MFEFKNLNQDEIKRIVKFGITGVINTLVDVGIYSLLAVLMGTNVFIAQFCGYTAGMLNSFLINRSWTFKTSDRFFSLQLVKFVITNLVVLVISMFLLKVFMDFFGMGRLIAKLVTICFTIVLNFLISRFWVFK
ncbi:GtrA family protein [Oscillospiraceae bacterium PP1C4]